MGELAELWNKQTPLHTGTLVAQVPALGPCPSGPQIQWTGPNWDGLRPIGTVFAPRPAAGRSPSLVQLA